MGPRTKWHWWHKWRLWMDSTTLTTTQQNWPGYSYCWVPDLSTVKTNTESWIWYYSMGCPSSNLHLTTSSKERTMLFPYINRYLFWSWIYLSYKWWFCQNYYLWPYRMPYSPSWQSTEYCFWPRNSFKAREVWLWAHNHWIYWSCCVPHHSEATSLIEKWK